ncbi:putative glucosyltransferase [alpha proteobacterium IMCC14465]|uniref:Putative glucosyltransferase n=1 Tax=alpha proteobacterium IMCC14465 TaxID=1220535 RepID=J9DHU5_9PROT|nr:putative glucosyltransferase [alpha proteobacterium IMCC14465]
MLKHILSQHIEFIYPQADTATLVEKICESFDISATTQSKFTPDYRPEYWDENDSFLITYGDTILSDDKLPLQNIHEFLENYLEDAITGVHILPYFPFTSDDGFAVSDYRAVRPDLGDWEDIQDIAKDYRLMSDVVINHASASHEWFKQFLSDENPGQNYIKTSDPTQDHSLVTRPRPSPLLIPFDTPSGEKHVWCTFGADQVDLDFSNPDLLCEFISLMRFYINKGVRVFRLDAVGFLWKEAGTNCLHLPQTHEIIKLIRTLVDHLDDTVLLITETNVPNHENLQYFDNGNEAHVIYNFSLPPLLVHALLTGRSTYLRRWMMAMPPSQDGCTLFNFSASHDGIGLRPVEGLLPEDEITKMIDTITGFGGRVTMRSFEGREVPYEMNTTLFSALKGTVHGEDGLHVDRFIASQTIMMSLEGIPAFYIQSLLASENDEARAAEAGHNRALNRTQWSAKNIDDTLSDETSPLSQIFRELKKRLEIRKNQKAFHPDATQFTLHLKPGMFGFWRQSLDRKQSLFVVTNITHEEKLLSLRDMNLYQQAQWQDLLSDKIVDPSDEVLTLKPYQSIWITNISG